MKKLFFTLIFIFKLTAQNQDSVKIYFDNNSTAQTLNILEVDSIKFVSFDDFSALAKGIYSFNPILKKGNLWLENSRLQFSASSEFYTAFDTLKKSFILDHFINKIEFVDSTLYIELNTFIFLISKFAKVNLSLVEPTKKIVTITPKPEKNKIEVAKKKLAEMKKLEEEKRKWMLDVIVIDPGHGGHDPGSIGVDGTYEKDVTLGVAAKLGRLIKQKLPEVEVLFTRTSDKFVELYKRGKFANDARGKLFISIHCNSHEVKPSTPKGFEIYILRPGKTAAAIKVAEKENSVIELEENGNNRYQKITEENFILLTMAQNGYMKQSEQFAEILEKEMGKKLETDSRGVKQAGFYVLVGASMPNVLIESGYLSNTQEEKFLSSQDGQQQIAKSIFESIRLYKVFHENQITATN